MSKTNDKHSEATAASFPSLGIDMNGCIDETTRFFQILTKYWPGKIFVVSYNSSRQYAEAELARYDIRYDELILVSSYETKAKVIREKAISVFFDDRPEVLKDICPNTDVMLVRNDGNFDFTDRRWKFSSETGKIV
jgi:hypothetical protein